jgi:hypothetical protein
MRPHFDEFILIVYLSVFMVSDITDITIIPMEIKLNATFRIINIFCSFIIVNLFAPNKIAYK